LRHFRCALQKGQEAEAAWVNEQRSHGRSVAHGVRIQADRFDPGRDHLQHPDAAGVFRIEIKTRRFKFTDKNDYPFETVFLANIANYHRDLTSPLIYVIQSEITGAWGWVIATDRDDTWKDGFKRDMTRNSMVHILECPRSFLRPPEELRKLLMHHEVLDLLDGRTDAFRPDTILGGAGAKTDPREPGAGEEGDQCVGRMKCKKSKKNYCHSDRRSTP